MATIPTHLLLLSFPPWPPSPEKLKKAYYETFKSVLQQLSDQIRVGTVGARLDVVVPVPVLRRFPNVQRSTLFPLVQSLVAGVYKLACTIAAREKINVEDAEGIDVCILLVAHVKDQNEAPSEKGIADNGLGPVVTLKNLVRCGRHWQSVFALEDDDGERLLREFTTSQDGRVKIQRIPGGTIDSSQVEELADSEDTRVHTSIAVGGTWDHVHIGHKLLLTMFAFLAQPQTDKRSVLTIGVTGDELLKNKKYAELLESWHERQLAVRNFLSHIIDFRPENERIIKEQEISNPGPNGHAVLYELGNSMMLNLVEIPDPFGPTITDESISALVLSAETRAGGKAVNDKRSAAGWPSLEVFEVDVLDPLEDQSLSTDDAFKSKLSSTAIRQALSERGKSRSKA